MADFDQGDDEWEPPTEAEMKVIQARRERSDKISKLMGDYLLKGYRMLGVCCRVCDTILLQEKQSNNYYCVACQELDADNIKDDPVLSDEAALRQAAEHSQRSSNAGSNHGSSPADTTVTRASAASASGDSGQSLDLTAVANVGTHISPVTPDLTRNIPRTLATSSSFPVQESASVRPKTAVPQPRTLCLIPPGSSTHDATVEHNSLVCLYDKLQSATSQLSRSENLNHSIELCQFIKHCADAIEALHGLQTIKHK